MSRPTVSIFALILLGIVLFVLQSWLPPELGAGDFRPYWSASYLLRTGQDFSSLATIDAAERTLTAWGESYTMMAWFAPTGNLVLLPYTFLPFALATRAWLITNLAVVFAGAYLLWQFPKRTWMPLAAAFAFSMTLLSLVYGQVNTLEVLGLALFLFLSARKQDFTAGASLVFTTIKPHLVILTLPLVLLMLLRRRRWRALAGFGAAGLACGLVLFAFYPSWPLSFWNLAASGMSSIRETPSFSGLLVLAGQFTIRKWLWGFSLALAVGVWWRYGKDWRPETLIDVSLLAGLMVAPVGWSYDQVMLLVPVIHLLKWTVDGSLMKSHALVVVAVLVAADVLSFLERDVATNEVWFFWVPLVVAVVYAFAWRARRENAFQSEK